MRILWRQGAHEGKVEQFYATGITDYHDHNGGYLNFGLWENGTTDYVVAAENLIHRIGSMTDMGKTSKVLDVACGMAPQCVYLHKTFGAEIHGIDVTWKHVELGQQRVKKAGVSKYVEISHGSATKLPFDESSFSHVTGVEGQPHFNTRDDFLGEAFRVLQPGGRLGLSDYTIERKPRSLYEKFLLWAAIKLWACRKENAYSSEVYRQKLKETGFTKIEIKSIGDSVIPGYIHFQRQKETIKQLKKVRGWFGTYGGLLIDYFMNQIFKRGIMAYVLVTAEKPSQ